MTKRVQEIEASLSKKEELRISAQIKLARATELNDDACRSIFPASITLSVLIIEIIPEDIHKNIPEDIPKEIPEGIPKDSSKDIPKDSSKYIPKDITEDILEDFLQELPKRFQKLSWKITAISKK